MIQHEIELVEVGPRDGLQNEAVILSTADKVTLIRNSVAAGIRRIEVASFVHPMRVPQMADAEAVCAQLTGLEAVRIGLVLNRRGAERAVATVVDELGAVVSASDGFGMANQGRTSEETASDAAAIFEIARNAGRRCQATISVAFGCPFDGKIAPERVADLARKLADAGAHEIALADTIGAATPIQVEQVMHAVARAAPAIPLRLHFHDTRNMGVANAWTAVCRGAATLDASVGGIGGCPFAPGATGNVASEDLLYLLAEAKIATGVSIDKVIALSRWLGDVMGRGATSKLARVGPFRPPLPA